MRKGILDPGARGNGGIVGPALLMLVAGGCASTPNSAQRRDEPICETATRVAAARLGHQAVDREGTSSDVSQTSDAVPRTSHSGRGSSFWDWDRTFRLAGFEGQTTAGESSTAVDRSATASAPSPVQVDRGPLPGFWETVERDVKLFPKSLWDDTKKVYTDPRNMIVLLSAGGASLALRPEVDDDFEDDLRGKDIFKDDWNDAFGALGNPGTHFALAGVWYLAGQQLQNVKTYEVGRTLFNALAINGVSTILLQVAAYTEAPNGERLGWPSGHTSSTVALAAVLDEAYGPLVGIPLYGLAGLVAVERMDDGEHHFSDVVFGAVLGYVVGKTVAKDHRPEIFGGEIVPYADPVGGSSGVMWVKNFK